MIIPISENLVQHEKATGPFVFCILDSTYKVIHSTNTSHISSMSSSVALSRLGNERHLKTLSAIVYRQSDHSALSSKEEKKRSVLYKTLALFFLSDARVSSFIKIFLLVVI